jgi:predicted lipoprotein with Yx(FWY)xxD motif
LTSNTARRTRNPRQLWTARAAVAVAIAGTLTSVAVGVTAAQAAPDTMKKAVVVHHATRHPFGSMLTTVRGRSLYILPSGSCSGACLSAWPPLLMPAGKTIPLGNGCLGTAKFGRHHRLQVTYRKKRLYLFSGDSGTSVNGNGVAGFKVAKRMSGRCPR